MESYIHTLYSENPALCDIPPNAPVQGYYFVLYLLLISHPCLFFPFSLQICMNVLLHPSHVNNNNNNNNNNSNTESSKASKVSSNIELEVLAVTRFAALVGYVKRFVLR